MPQYIDVEPEFVFKVEEIEGDGRLLSIGCENGPDIRIAWDSESWSKLLENDRALSLKLASPEDMPDGANGAT